MSIRRDSRDTFRAQYRLQGDRDDNTAWRTVGIYPTRKLANRALEHAKMCEHETRVIEIPEDER